MQNKKFNGKVLANVIRERRLQLNYSQDYVAMQVEMSQTAYSKLEQGYTAITVDRFFLLCGALETEPTALLGRYHSALNASSAGK